MLLLRTDESDQGTFGILVFNDQYLYTGELPWRDNRPNLSCIPEGKYEVQLRNSPRYGNVYEVTSVTGRSHILLHHGNFCGDSAKGFRTNVRGCILLGTRRGKLAGQSCVLASKIARRRFETFMNKKPFTLEIRTC